jgi:hypothetical protein
MLRPRGMTLLPRLSLSLLLEKAPKTNYPWLGVADWKLAKRSRGDDSQTTGKSLCDGSVVSCDTNLVRSQAT